MDFIVGQVDSWWNILDYELVRGNGVWRFMLVLLGIIGTFVVAMLFQYFANLHVKHHKDMEERRFLSLVLQAIVKPAYVGIFAIGLNVCKVFLYFNEENGIKPAIEAGWTKTAQVVGAVAVAYALYSLVDVAEYYLNRLVRRTKTELDDMLVPLLRKSLRVTIAIIAALYVAENTVGTDHIKSLLVGAGIGGIAIAMAAKDTVANFFGSITIFADRPFQLNELVEIEGNMGFIEDVGFRSTRIRTLDGHLVTLPNSIVTNSVVINIGNRPHIRREFEITITYNSGSMKTAEAVDIIKKVLAETPEVNTDTENPSRVYFSEFASCSLNIYIVYWVVPADRWVFREVNERVNFEIMKRFEQAGIEFAFPTQTLYLKKDDGREE
ncbi:MscS family inner membrane protein YnaI [Anaerohalosphaera lusitana]|uniref:MscS family inner membrane protein YnaI n=1 Tax=Anaerohalosphaera lusitana TaxID=1936003 RepID=A0A1U9NQK4_9BACT|nr:mechanosensitive ion channel domain-containing protein [Anaerohalosphaera lusitana]AQT70014.1 MscS family inner membrane protein YnaI [Anaerohalosphaera lusitana]